MKPMSCGKNSKPPFISPSISEGCSWAAGKASRVCPLPTSRCCFQTTDEYCLLQPLRDRMRLVLRFEFYSDDELTTVLRHRAKCLRWEVEEAGVAVDCQAFEGDATTCLAVAAIVLSSLPVDKARRCITSDHLQRACSLEQIDELGLGPIEQRYVGILKEGPTRLNVIASMIGLPSRTVCPSRPSHF